MRKLFVSGVCARIGQKTFLCVAEEVAVPPVVDFVDTVSDEIRELVKNPLPGDGSPDTVVLGGPDKPVPEGGG